MLTSGWGLVEAGSLEKDCIELELAAMRFLAGPGSGSIWDGLEISVSLEVKSSSMESAMAAPSNVITQRRNRMIRRGGRKDTFKFVHMDWHEGGVLAQARSERKFFRADLGVFVVDRKGAESILSGSERDHIKFWGITRLGLLSQAVAHRPWQVQKSKHIVQHDVQACRNESGSIRTASNKHGPLSQSREGKSRTSTMIDRVLGAISIFLDGEIWMERLRSCLICLTAEVDRVDILLGEKQEITPLSKRRWLLVFLYCVHLSLGTLAEHDVHV